MNLSEVPVLTEGRRGCGYRKAGGLYLVSGPGLLTPCGKLPLVLDVCPTCRGGIKPTRSYEWVNAWALFGERTCSHAGTTYCSACPLGGQLATADSPLRMGLIWIGESFYPTPADWMAETDRMGASRRIPNVPRDFEVGKTWVLVAHRKAIPHKCDCVRRAAPDEELFGRQEPAADCKLCSGKGVWYEKAIFHAFKPTRIEYVCKGDETEEELDKMIGRGISPVIVREKAEAEEVTT